MMLLLRPNLKTLLRQNKRKMSNAPDIFPRATSILYLPNLEKRRKRKSQEQKGPIIPHSVITRGPRVNQMDVQMLSKPIYQHIFKNLSVTEVNAELVEKCKKSLEKHGITKETDMVEDVDFVIPPLEGKDIEDHFKKIGEDQVKQYVTIIHQLLLKIPEKPINWVMQQGWTRYLRNKPPQKVDYPLEDCLVFDTEVCMAAGKAPTLATAVSSKAWYGWVSQSLIDGASKPVTSHMYFEDSLIPFEPTQSPSPKHQTKNVSKKIYNPLSKINKPLSQINGQLKNQKPRIIIGHNVSFDRAKIKEQYYLENTGTRFLDTMSMHISVSGLTSYQRAVLKSKKEDPDDDVWKNCSSLNSLSEVHKLYCGEAIEKETRNIFVDGNLTEIKSEFHTVMDYCANDVIATYSVLKSLFPLFCERFPHPVTLAGMLELSTAYLPVNSNWERYFNDSEQTYQDLEIESRLLLAKRADSACQLLHDDKYREDLWMWDLDWDVKELKLKKKANLEEVVTVTNGIKRLEEETDQVFNNLFENAYSYKDLEARYAKVDQTKAFLSAVKTLLPGYPNWYRKLCTKPDSDINWIPGPHLITTSMQVTPKLLNLTWEGYPLHFIRGLGWGLLVPFSTDTDIERKLPLIQLLEKCPVLTLKTNEADVGTVNIVKQVEDNLARKEYYSKVKQDKTDGLYKGTGVWCNTIIEDCCFFIKLPHKDGASFHVGNPLAKDFLNKFSENVLAGDTDSAEKVLAIARQMSYWRNNRDRIFNQMVVWVDNSLQKDEKYGAIVPQVVVCGTLTRRAVEPTWMTASNAHPERVGSELRAMIQSPPGYCIVGADVDSQELWIASVIGDANSKMHGATPFGWMTLSGNKANGTDMHSVTAKAVGISRDHAKVINYARIYGAGQNFAERLIKQFNPAMSDGEARSKANKMFTLTKGKLIYRLKPEYIGEFADVPYSKWQAAEVAKLHGKRTDEFFLKSQWVGGTESAMFNRLEEIAGTPEPSTPFLGSRLSRALEPSSMPGDRFLPTRINWVVQSGAVDFLHLMLVCMRWIMGDKIRFCLSFHDEIRYLVPEEYKYQAALAMHVTNLLTRAFCSARLGLNDLPQSVAFFSSVEIDTCLRKESKHDCKTPSNPHGLEGGYGIKNGESLTIYDAIKKAKGTRQNWHKF